MKRREWISALGALSITSIISDALAKGDLLSQDDAGVGTPAKLGDKVARLAGARR